MIRFKLKERIANKEFRDDRRITLIEIAQATGIGRITLSRMLKPGAVARTDTLDKLCEYLDCGIQDLVEHIREPCLPGAVGETAPR
jgi:putative transcriptional regulator